MHSNFTIGGGGGGRGGEVGGDGSEAWNQVIAPVKKFGQARLSIDLVENIYDGLP